VDVVRAYSKRPDLLDDLNRTVYLLERAEMDERVGSRPSVRSTGRRGTVEPVLARLSEAEVAELVAGWQAGKSLRELARRYEINRDSVRRLVRRLEARA
jgi:DNA-binding CsgD family transcriptional regulator